MISMITNRDVLDFIMEGVNELMYTQWDSLEDWAEAIDLWCDDYENGVFDDLKIEAHDVYYDEVLRSCYHKLVDQLETIGDMMYEEWEQNLQC